jgi:hypothetical protein
VTGNYLVPPLSAADAAAAARGQVAEAGHGGWLRRLRDALLRRRALPFDVDPIDVARAGWGIVFAADTPSEVRGALEPLIAHRRRHVPPERCKVLEYRPGEAMRDWLKRHGVYTGSVAPTKVPYYLLLVGEPAAIPFEFQYLLDIEYAVGRLAFDRPDPYRLYAESVVAYETSATVPTAREVVYWGTRHPADRATQMSADCLITPLLRGVPAAPGQEQEPAIAEVLGFRGRGLLGRDATKANLAEVLHSARPALVFTASHGMGWPRGHENQLPAQGALLCQDWSGFGSVRPDHYLAAADIAADARLHGLVAFFFACYGAGTPAFDPFLTDRGRGPVAVAERAFVAALPQRLLAHPGGGALAVLGHVERAWGYSIRPPGVGPQLVPFRNGLGRILRGEPVGHATKDFSEKFAALSAELLDQLDETRPRPWPDERELARTWIERNDAQNYIVLGDPAVRLAVATMARSPDPDRISAPVPAGPGPEP